MGARVSYYTTDLTDQDFIELCAQDIIENEALTDVIINSARSVEWLSFNEPTLSHFKNIIDSPYIVTALAIKVFLTKCKIAIIDIL